MTLPRRLAIIAIVVLIVLIVLVALANSTAEDTESE